MNTIVLAILIISVLLGMTNSVAAVYAQQVITAQQRSAVEEDKAINDILDICRTGLLIYKDITGKIAVVCIIDRFNSQLVNVFDQRLDVDIDVKDNDNRGGDRDHDGKDRDHDNDDDGPDGDCLFKPSLPKCAVDEGENCPDGFFRNGYDQCVPRHPEGCPDGYHSVDDDETGQCIDDDEGCPEGMEFRTDGKTCGYEDELCPDENNPYCSTDEDEEDQPISLEPITCESGFVFENGKCAALDSNCGGVPCTASDKEDSTTSDPIPGEPHTPTTDTDSEEIVEEEEDTSNDSSDNEDTTESESDEEEGGGGQEEEETGENDNEENDDSSE